MRLALLLCVLASCKNVALVPTVGASGYDNGSYGGHVAVSFFPAPEVPEARATFRPAPDLHVPATFDRDFGANLVIPARDPDPAPVPAPDHAAVRAAWIAELERDGWARPAVVPADPPTGEDPEADGSATGIRWGGLEISVAALTAIGLAALEFFRRKRKTE